jgi:diguanylate cyclase (GGDEF)-like protein
LLLLDVDHFKQINDSQGHAAGDEVLRTIGQIASEQAGWTIGRLGGDEFAVIVSSTDHRALRDVLDGFMRSLLSALHGESRTGAYRGLSVGIAMAPADATTTADLLNNADLALYEGKRKGRGSATFFNPIMQRKHRESRQVSRDLHAAILMDQLEVHYQPIPLKKSALLSV